MSKRPATIRLSCLAAVIGALATLGLAPSAFAHTGEFARFNDCPSTTPGVFKCVVSVTNGGYITLGKKKTPIVNPVTLQGGYSEGRIAKFFGAVNGGVTLSKTAQPVPGGLAGLVNCDEISNFFERIACELVFENEATGVNATLELAAPATSIEVSEYNMLLEEGLALKLPVKVHLENLFLGSSCYIGSNAAPIIWNLTSGTTSPPSGFKAITGSSGTASLKEEDEIAQLTGNILVENDWAAPEPNGCSEPFGFLLDPLIGLKIGLPAKAGENIAHLENTIDIASAEGLNEH
jgi:hypothetical protein